MTETQTIGVSNDTAKEVLRLSEIYLDGTLRLSIAADSRALSMSSMLAAASTLLIGYGSATLFSSISPVDPQKVSLAIGALTSGAIFLFALFSAIKSVQPRPFHVLGNVRSNWSDEELRGNLADALLSQAVVYEEQISENKAVLQKNAARINRALQLTLSAIPAAVAIGLLCLLLLKKMGF